MKESLISCIVPVLNGELYLAEALESILNQTYRPLEIIVADDGSSDGTAAVVARYSTQVRYLWQPNAGVAAARNLGLSAALGDFVAFLDADDLWHAEKLERQMARFEARPELELCVTHVRNFWIPELREEEARFQNHRFSQPLPGYTTQALLARRVLFDAVGPFNIALRAADDADWFLRAAEQRVMMDLLPHVLVYRRLHHTNISRTPVVYSSILKVIKMSLDRRRGHDGGVPRAYEFPASDRGEKHR